MNRKRIGSLVLAAVTAFTAFAYTPKQALAAESRFTAVSSYSDGQKFEFKKEFDFNESYFENSSYTYNHDLANASLGLAVSGFSSLESKEFYGESADVGRQKNIASVYEQLGFTNASYYNYDVSLNDNSPKVAFAIAKKKISDDTLVSLVVRGGIYGAEWGSNFIVGNGDRHEAWNTAAKEVAAKLNQYIGGPDQNVKIWITGYSRGAAVSNLVAADLIDSKNYNPANIYTYLFAVPQPVAEYSKKLHPNGAEVKADRYQNIFNILNPADTFPNMPLNVWGFTRYGVDKIFPANSQYYSTVAAKYAELNGGKYDQAAIEKQKMQTRSLEEVLVGLYDKQPDYVKKLQNVLSKWATYLYTRKQDANNGWTARESLITFLSENGAKMEKSYTVAKKALDLEEAVRTKLKLGKPLSEEKREMVALMVSFCETNGFTVAEVKRISTAMLNYLKDNPDQPDWSENPTIIDASTAHHPETYIAWMSTIRF